MIVRFLCIFNLGRLIERVVGSVDSSHPMEGESELEVRFWQRVVVVA